MVIQRRSNDMTMYKARCERVYMSKPKQRRTKCAIKEVMEPEDEQRDEEQII
jgi:hypothetical protein